MDIGMNMETVLMVDTYVAVAVAVYVVVLGALRVVPWVPHVFFGVVVTFLVPIFGPLAILAAGIWLHVRHRRATR